MPALLFPAALAALLGLVVPLLVHLARRSEARPTDFAALEWLREKPRPKSRLRFDEWVLLVLRLLLFAGIALWLARPVLPDSADRSPVVAAVPGVDAGPPTAGARRIWLTTGFPSGDEPQTSCLVPAATATPNGNTAGRGGAAVCPPLLSLIRQLDAELPAGVPLTLIIPEILAGLDAERPRLSRPVTWTIAAGAMPAAAALPQKLRFTIGSEPDPGLRYIRAAATALRSPDARTETPIIVHFIPGTLPETLRASITDGASVLVAHTVTAPGAASPVWRDADGLPLATLQRIGRGRLYRFTRPLTPEAMPILLDADFPRQLAAMLAPQPPPTRAMARDVAPTMGAAPWLSPARDLQPWLAFAIAALFLAERWLATRRSRAVSP